MKLRKLKKLLNDTGYKVQRKFGSINYYDDETKHDIICIGSPYIHDIISYDVESKKFGHASSFNPEREKDFPELVYLWNRMHELAESGELDEIASGNDEIFDPIPVFTFRDYKIVKTFTEKDEFGWPYIDNEGWLMYEDTAFKTEAECIDYAINEMGYWLKMFSENLHNEIVCLERKVKLIAKESAVLVELLKQQKKDKTGNVHGGEE